MKEIHIDERPRCPRCGGPANVGMAILCGALTAASIELPPVCADVECRRIGQAERDEAAIARAIAAGVIDP